MTPAKRPRDVRLSWVYDNLEALTAINYKKKRRRVAIVDVSKESKARMAALIRDTFNEGASTDYDCMSEYTALELINALFGAPERKGGKRG